jgi:hypothetical protein
VIVVVRFFRRPRGRRHRGISLTPSFSRPRPRFSPAPFSVPAPTYPHPSSHERCTSTVASSRPRAFLQWLSPTLFLFPHFDAASRLPYLRPALRQFQPSPSPSKPGTALATVHSTCQDEEKHLGATWTDETAREAAILPDLGGGTSGEGGQALLLVPLLFLAQRRCSLRPSSFSRFSRRLLRRRPLLLPPPPLPLPPRLRPSRLTTTPSPPTVSRRRTGLMGLRKLAGSFRR